MYELKAVCHSYLGLLGGNSIEFSSIFDQSPAYQLAAKPNQVKYDIERYGRLKAPHVRVLEAYSSCRH